MFQNYITMKKLLTLFAIALAIVVSSCSKFDDSAIWDKLNEQEQTLNDHEKRIAALEELCKQMNTNISALQTIVEALEKNDYITNVSPVRKDGEVIGYTITFAHSDTITIYNGKDGADGYVPNIGVMKDVDGIYYWTLDGEWLLDGKDNKIQANGVDGTNGDNGTTPRLKIENDYWYVSYDEGATWVELGKATGEDGANGIDGDSIFSSVTQDDEYVYFNLANGSVISIAIKNHTLDIVFDNTDGLACYPGTSVEVSYTIVGCDDSTVIECLGDGDWSALIIKESKTSGKIKVNAPKEATSGKVIVLATSGVGDSVMKSLYFDEGILTDILNAYEVDWEICTLNVTLKTNLNYTVNIPVDWITIADTRAAIRTDTLKFSIVENPEEMPRTATIELIGECGDILQSFEIAQKQQPSDGYIEFADKYAKLVCVQKFDTNGDGELSFKEASRVTSTGRYFFGDYAPIIKSFDELQYFTELTSINDYAFSGCSGLTSITIGNSVTSIGNYAFNKCNSLTSITIHDSVISIGDYVFNECDGLVNATIGNNVTSIGDYTFFKCSNLTGVTIGSGISSIGGHAFYGCSSIISINIPDKVTTIGQYAFYNCSSLTSINIPDGVTTIESSVFYGCASLKTITIPESVTIIGKYAFDSCSSLTSVTIPTSVTSIGRCAFNYCRSLENVYCKAIIPPTGGEYMFDKNADSRNIYVPMVSVDVYQSAGYWSWYGSSIIGYDLEE